MELKRVVITGLGALTPIGNSIEEYWSSLINGVSGAAPITHFDASKFKTQFACELKNFDVLEHLDRKEARKMDRFTQYAMVASEEAISDSKIDIKSIQNAIENYTPKNNRSEVLNTKDKKIILDAYNANPTSMRLAIDSFFKLSGSKALILADMLELGVYSNDEHLEIINHLEKENTGKTYLVGEEFYKLKKESNSISFYKTKNELILEISNNKILEKNILIKGSRAMKMEELINLI